MRYSIEPRDTEKMANLIDDASNQLSSIKSNQP